MKTRCLVPFVGVLVTISSFFIPGPDWAEAATGPVDPTKTRIAYPLTTPPVIDGEIDPSAEWALSSYHGWNFRVDDTLDDGLLGSTLGSGEVPDDDADLSADIYAGVTEEALYIGVVVFDDDISTDTAAAGSENGETWLDDGVEIFIDGDNSNFAERDTTGTNPEVVGTGGQFVITANNAYRHAEAGNPAYGPNGGWYAQAKKSADGYHAEFRIPLNMIGNPKRGEFIGFTVAVNDDDGGGPSEGQVIWTGMTHVEASYGNLFIGHRQYEGLKATPPAIDGVIGVDEYPGAEVVVINPHTGVYRVGDDEHPVENHAFEWRLTHDEDAIYVAARVTDNMIVADTAEPNSEDGQTWVDDSVEIFFDSNESNLPGRDPNEMFDGQFVFTTNGAWRDNEANNPTFGPDEHWFAASTVIDDNTWEVEFMILKSALVGGSTQDAAIGFNININDDDGAGDRGEQLNWGGSPHNEYTYSELILLSAIPSDPNAVADRSVKFGRLDKNSARGEETLSIRNAGSTQTLTLSGAAISGPNADAFTLVDFPETIAPSETATATIGFDSQGMTGSFNATLTYTTNDPDPSEANLAAALSASVLNLGGPQARYALDETEGTVMLDRTGYNRHGVYEGAGLGQEALVSGASARFNDGSYAAIPGDQLGALDRFSVAMTVNLEDVASFQTLFAKGAENGSPTLALLNSDGTLQWFTDGTPEFGTTDAVITAGEIHHVAVTWAPGSAVIYVDGAPVASQDNPAALDIVVEDPFVLGSFFGNLNMNGRMDDVQIYDRAISAEDVAFLAANPDSELELDGENPEPVFTELWLLGDAGNGNQSEFSQEQGMDTAPGSATAQDDDFYFHGIYPDPIGTVTASEPFTNYDRAHVPSDPFNRIHFNLDADSAAADTLLRMTFALCCYGAADNGPSEHDMVFRLNGKEFFSENGINSDRVIQETVTAGDFNVTAGANTIEIERTGGSASSWVQYDYVRLEATAGEPVPAPGGGGGELPAGAHPLDAVSTGDGLSAYYWNLPPVTMLTVNEPLHRAGDGPAGADNSNSGWADENVYNALAPTGTFSATTFDYQGNDLTPINEWLGGDAAGYSGGDGNLGDGVFRFVGYVRVEEAGNRTFTTTSDDGSVVYVNDQLVISNDNGHGNQTVSANVNFPAPGYYPIDVRYFNGDWTNEAGEHGGANFIGEAGFTGVVQGLDGVAPLYTPPTGGGTGDRGFVLQDIGIGANGAFSATIPAGVTANIEYSPDLITWEVIATGVSGVLVETDAARLAAPEGYYRGVTP